MKLLIVESPAKARTLKRLLKGFSVEATLGHIKDLPKNKLGVDIAHGFKPTYVVLPGKKKVLQRLASLAAKSEEIYLASDPDREGEAIAWHVAEEIAKKAKDKPIKRVLFHEITKNGVLKALKQPGELDSNKYVSQQTRRILDRLVGYQISPLLWEKVKRGLSAGRVQSVALRLICEREREIQKFVPKEYWEIVATFLTEDASFQAKLFRLNGQKPHIVNAEQANSIVEKLQNVPFVVQKVVSKERRRYPLPPFITSTMQQEAAKRLGFPAKKTMLIAQQLYEGIDLGQNERVGLITYMRTDSVRTADEAIKTCRSLIQETFGKSFLPVKPYQYKNKRSAQDAHEAIRPTDPFRTPDMVAPYLTPDQLALYTLIWKRFVASQMAAAVYDQTTVDIIAADCLFRATGSILKFPGFQKIYEINEKGEGEILPEVQEGEQLKVKEILPVQHFTKPPARYTEASLIKELEEKGIGRPSTYATILSTIQERNYVIKESGKFKPTELGILVNELLVSNFPDIVDVSFTAKMEEKLDAIEEGKAEGLEILKAFYEVFEAALNRAKTEMLEVKSQGIATDIVCDKCGAPMVIKYGKNGAFLACSRYPECRNTKDFERNDKGEIVVKEERNQEVQERCPKCGQPLVVKKGRYGSFLACSAYPKCQYTAPLKSDEDKVDKQCPQCGAPLVVKRNKKGGRFLACSRYPECKYTEPFSLGIKCPKCGQGEIVERISAKGRIFYSCSRYPECKFACWERPVASPCPQCGAPFRVIKGKNLVCLTCKYKEPTEE